MSNERFAGSGEMMTITKRLPLASIVILPALSAVMLAFCFPGASAWWMAWFALVPLYFALLSAGGDPKRGAVIGGVWGFVLHIVACFWMSALGVVPWLGVSVFETGAFAVFGAVAAVVLFRLPGWARPVVFAALWVCLEYGRSVGVMAFPWFPLAATQVPCLPMVQIASVTGQWGVSFAVAVVNALLVESFASHKAKDAVSFRWFAGAAVYVPVAVCVYGWWVLAWEPGLNPHPTDKTRTVAIIQGNIGKVPENADRTEYRWQSLQTYLQMTRAAVIPPLPPAPSPPVGGEKGGVSGSVDVGLPAKPSVSGAETPPFSPPTGGEGAGGRGGIAFILWPETVVPGYLRHDQTLFSAITALARETGTPLLAGTPDSVGLAEYNSVAYLDATGGVRHVYSKQRLVPMGEFFPLREQLGNIYEQYSVPNDDLTPGTESGTFDVGDGAGRTRVGLLICFESVFPYISRDRVKNGAQVLAQATSDQTYDGTPNPKQHAELCVLRAIETRRYFVRAGATGLSQIIDAEGRVRRSIPTGKAGTIVDTFVLRSGETFFVRFGDWFVTACGIVTASAILHAATRKRPAARAELVASSEEVERPA